MTSRQTLSWKMDDTTREILFECLKKHDEAMSLKLRLLHAVAAADFIGEALSQDEVKKLCPDYPGKQTVIEMISGLIKTFMPAVIYYSPSLQLASTEPFQMIEEECIWCTNFDFEESLICPSCYGRRKIKKTVSPTDTIPYNTYDVFVCKQVKQE